jgi:hypothetical protein
MLGFGENESKYVSPRVHVCGQKCGLAHIHCTCGKSRLPRRSGPVDNAPRREEKQSGAASSVRIRRGSLGARYLFISLDRMTEYYTIFNANIK